MVDIESKTSHIIHILNKYITHEQSNPHTTHSHNIVICSHDVYIFCVHHSEFCKHIIHTGFLFLMHSYKLGDISK